MQSDDSFGRVSGFPGWHAYRGISHGKGRGLAGKSRVAWERANVLLVCSMEQLAVSDDALKLLVAEHGVRGTARLLQMDERQTDTFRQRVTRGKWLADPAIAAIRARSTTALTGRPALPAVAALSPQAALLSELQALGGKTRLSLGRAVAKAGEHLETLDGASVVADAGNVKNIAQTADLIHGWKDAAPQVKIRLDVLNASPAESIPTIEAESSVVTDWGTEDCDLDSY